MEKFLGFRFRLRQLKISMLFLRADPGPVSRGRPLGIVNFVFATIWQGVAQRVTWFVLKYLHHVSQASIQDLFCCASAL
jgi:hypothetical protein